MLLPACRLACVCVLLVSAAGLAAGLAAAGESAEDFVRRAHAAARGDETSAADPAASPAFLFASAARLEPREPSHFSNLGSALMNTANNEPATDAAVQLYVHAERAYRRAARLWRRGRPKDALPESTRAAIRAIRGDVKTLHENCRLRFDENCRDMPEASPTFRQRTPLSDTGALAIVAQALKTSSSPAAAPNAPPPKSSAAQKRFLKQQYGTGAGRVLQLDDSADALRADPMAQVAWNFRDGDFATSTAWPKTGGDANATGTTWPATKRAITRLKRTLLAAGFYQDNVLDVLQEDIYQGYSPERTSKQGIGSGMRARDQLLERIEAYEARTASAQDPTARHQRTVLSYLVRLFFAGLTVDSRLLREEIGDDAMALLFLDSGGLGILERHPLEQVHKRGKRSAGKRRRKKRRRKKRRRTGEAGERNVTEGDKNAYAISSRVQITPIREDLHVITDWHQTQSRETVEPVMYIGGDSRGLVWAQPPIRTEQVLDLCTGSGVQGIVAARYYADRVVLVDFNPRAVRFARMNVVLNGLEDKATVVLGDLYGALDTNEPPRAWGRAAKDALGTSSWGKFGAILANPPFLPIAEGSIGQNAYGDGGPDGERVFRRIVEEAPLHLTPQGRVHITSNLLDPHVFDHKLWKWWSTHLKDNWETDRVTGHRERYMRAPSGQVAAFHMIRSEIWTQADYGQVVEDHSMGEALKIAGIEYATKGFIFIYANREPERAHQHSSYTVHNDHHSIWNVVSTNKSAAHALLEKYHNLDGHFDGESYPFGSGYPYKYYVGSLVDDAEESVELEL